MGFFGRLINRLTGKTKKIKGAAKPNSNKAKLLDNHSNSDYNERNLLTSFKDSSPGKKSLPAAVATRKNSNKPPSKQTKKLYLDAQKILDEIQKLPDTRKSESKRNKLINEYHALRAKLIRAPNKGILELPNIGQNLTNSQIRNAEEKMRERAEAALPMPAGPGRRKPAAESVKPVEPNYNLIFGMGKPANRNLVFNEPPTKPFVDPLIENKKELERLEAKGKGLATNVKELHNSLQRNFTEKKATNFLAKYEELTGVLRELNEFTGEPNATKKAKRKVASNMANEVRRRLNTLKAAPKGKDRKALEAQILGLYAKGPKGVEGAFGTARNAPLAGFPAFTVPNMSGENKLTRQIREQVEAARKRASKPTPFVPNNQFNMFKQIAPPAAAAKPGGNVFGNLDPFAPTAKAAAASSVAASSDNHNTNVDTMNYTTLVEEVEKLRKKILTLPPNMLNTTPAGKRYLKILNILVQKNKMFKEARRAFAGAAPTSPSSRSNSEDEENEEDNDRGNLVTTRVAPSSAMAASAAEKAAIAGSSSATPEQLIKRYKAEIEELEKERKDPNKWRNVDRIDGQIYLKQQLIAGQEQKIAHIPYKNTYRRAGAILRSKRNLEEFQKPSTPNDPITPKDIQIRINEITRLIKLFLKAKEELPSKERKQVDTNIADLERIKGDFQKIKLG